ncbi:hypothetical protein RND81_02G204500 [Saponaria officinalis]|uniref:Secreted protein n=1 Tax=Saponaria officinalis TaxID=3572 RepID=A0AAW1MVW3_SAPOF
MNIFAVFVNVCSCTCIVVFVEVAQSCKVYTQLSHTRYFDCQSPDFRYLYLNCVKFFSISVPVHYYNSVYNAKCVI